MNTIIGAIFDLDDTLYLERDYVYSGYCAVAEHLRQRTGRDEPFEQWLWARFERGQAAGALDELDEYFALGLGKAGVIKLVDVYREHRPNIAPIAGVGEALSMLAPEFRLGLLADGFLPAQRLKLEVLGLERFFEAVVFNEELGRHAWKPSPMGFNRMQELLGLPHGSLAYISDNPAKDFVAPNKLGWRTIQWVWPGQVHASNPAPDGGRPQYVVRTPGELRAALRE